MIVVSPVSNKVASNLAGMSALWHEADYRPDTSLHVPQVVTRFPDEAELLPSEEHQLPRGVDAFARLDEVYEAAGAQMERGLEGKAFLHGKPPPAAVDRLAATAGDEPPPDNHDVTRTFVQGRGLDPDRKADVRGAEESRAIADQLQKRAEAGQAPLKASNATKSSRDDAARATKTLEMAEGIGVTMAAVAAGQAIDPVGGSMAAEAASVVKAVSTAKTAVGMTRAMDEMPETARSEHLRRGLSERRRGATLEDPVEPVKPRGES